MLAAGLFFAGMCLQMCLNLKTDNGDAMTDHGSDYLATPREAACLLLAFRFLTSIYIKKFNLKLILFIFQIVKNSFFF